MMSDFIQLFMKMELLKGAKIMLTFPSKIIINSDI